MNFEVTVIRVKFCRILVAVSSTLVAFGAGAHHSVAYYGDVYTEVRGVVVDVDWINPHVRLTVEAENGTGTWRMEGSSVYPLRSAGVTADQVPVGTRVTAIGKPSTREEFMMLVETIRLEDGCEPNSTTLSAPYTWIGQRRPTKSLGPVSATRWAHGTATTSSSPRPG